MMAKHCLLCGARVQDATSYLENENRYVRLTRYQRIVDVLIDSGLYSVVYFDHDTELQDPYRGIARHRRNALQEQPGKGRELHKKWPDVVAVRGLSSCDVVVEEERQSDVGKAQRDIDIITRCRYLWVDGMQFDLVNPVLFILLDTPVGDSQLSVSDNVGTFARVVICDKAEFGQTFERYYLQRGHI